MSAIRLWYRFCRALCRWVCVLLLKFHSRGLHNVPRRGGVLLLANHQSFMDPVLVGLAVPRECGFMARDTLFRNPIFGRLIASVNAYTVQRNSADLGAIKETLRRLKQGQAVVMFPEGTRTADGRIGPLLPGLAAIAQKARVPIVPVLIDGVFQAWPRHQLLPSAGNVLVIYDRPIPPAEFQHLNAGRLTELIRRRLVSLQRDLHGRLPERRLPWFHESFPEITMSKG